MNPEQDVLLRMFKDISSIFDENGIRYYGYFGTAIGAVRHKGFIPWDDDIDILVAEEDMPDVDRVLSEGLDREMYYYHVSRADTHPHVILRTDDMEGGLRSQSNPFIDIFVLSKYPSKKLRKILFDTFLWGELISVNVISRFKVMAMYRCFRWTIPFFRSLCKHTVDKDSRLRTPICHSFKKCVFDVEDYGAPVFKEFEDTVMPLPSDYHSMLTSIYGEYMVLPPENKRSGASGYPCSVVQDYITDRHK